MATTVSPPAAASRIRVQSSSYRLLSSYSARPSRLFESRRFHHTAFQLHSVTRRVPVTRHESRCVVHASAVQSEADLESRLAAFCDWLSVEGVLDGQPVKPVVLEGGLRLGLVATRDIRPRDDVVSIPEDLCLSLQTLSKSPLAPACDGLLPWVSLALFLLHERNNPASKWAPYINILPTQLSSPLFWTEEQLQLLEGTQLQSSVQQYLEYIASEHASAVEALSSTPVPLLPPDSLSLEDFTWAFAVLRSRCFPPLIKDKIALVPLADLLNHSDAAPEVEWKQRAAPGLFGGGKRQVAVSLPSQTYSAGEQVFINYGRLRSNASLALDFGFVVRTPALFPLSSSSPDPSASSSSLPSLGGATAAVTSFIDSVSDMTSVGRAVQAVEAAAVAASSVGGESRRDAFTLTLEISSTDRFLEDKADVAEINGFGEAAEFDLAANLALPDTLLTFLRLVALAGPDAFLLEGLFRNTAWDHLSLPVSQENEEVICQGLLSASEQALAGYPTSLQQDLSLLPSLPRGSAEEMAVVVRAGEKLCLLQLKGWAEERLRNLPALEYYAERRLRDLGLLDETGDMTPWASVE